MDRSAEAQFALVLYTTALYTVVLCYVLHILYCYFLIILLRVL